MISDCLRCLNHFAALYHRRRNRGGGAEGGNAPSPQPQRWGQSMTNVPPLQTFFRRLCVILYITTCAPISHPQICMKNWKCIRLLIQHQHHTKSMIALSIASTGRLHTVKYAITNRGTVHILYVDSLYIYICGAGILKWRRWCKTGYESCYIHQLYISLSSPAVPKRWDLHTLVHFTRGHQRHIKSTYAQLHDFMSTNGTAYREEQCYR